MTTKTAKSTTGRHKDLTALIAPTGVVDPARLAGALEGILDGHNALVEKVNDFDNGQLLKSLLAASLESNLRALQNRSEAICTKRARLLTHKDNLPSAIKHLMEQK